MLQPSLFPFVLLALAVVARSVFVAIMYSVQNILDLSALAVECSAVSCDADVVATPIADGIVSAIRTRIRYRID